MLPKTSTIKTEEGSGVNPADAMAVIDVFQELYDAGRDLLTMGLPILPINGKRPCNATGNPAKKWQKVQCNEDRLLRGLRGALDPKPGFRTTVIPEAEPGIGLRMGPDAGIIDIEADSEGEHAAIQSLFRRTQQPKTVCYKSKRGMHYLFRWDDRLSTLGPACKAGSFTYRSEEGNTVTLRIGADKGSQSVIPPTPGRSYLPGCSFFECQVAPLPEIVIERLLEQARERQNGEKFAPDNRKSLKVSTEDCKGDAEQSANLGLTPAAIEDQAAKVYTEDSRGHKNSRAAWVETGDGRGSEINSLDDRLTPERIRLAIEQTLPDGPGQRHRRLFRFARLLKSMPEFTDLEDPRVLRPYVRAWFSAALPCITTKQWEATWLDFLEGWPRIEFLPSDEPIMQAFAAAIAAAYPPAASLFDDEDVQDLVALCAELQRRAPLGKPFFLDCRTIGRLLSVSHSTAAGWMRLLRYEQVIVRVTKGHSGKSSEYFFAAREYKAAA